MAATRGPIIFRCHENATRKKKNGDAKKNGARSRRGCARESAAQLSRRAAARPKAIELRRSLGLRAGAGSEQLHQNQTALSAFHRRQVRRAAQWELFRFD